LSSSDLAPATTLPELAGVFWRPRVDERIVRRREHIWTLTTALHTLPFIAAAALLALAKPVTLPVSLILLVHAWAIPELYAARGANVIRPRARAQGAATEPERRALGLLGDLVDHSARSLLECSGLVIERGRLGVWLLGEAGALLVRPRGRRVLCYCVSAVDSELPPGDRIAHLLLALRADESGFATVANLAFAGAPWRLRRRLAAVARPALAEAVTQARARA
jgi:hypothetical protein